MIDYLIIGQGISGTFLSYFLWKEGASAIVIDNNMLDAASKVASGVINPVTGRRIVKTWMIDEVMPFALNAYQQIGNVVKQPLIRQCNVLDFFPTTQMQQAFAERLTEEPALLSYRSGDNNQAPYFRFSYGVGEVKPCYLTDIQTMVSGWRNILQQNEMLLEETFDIDNLELDEGSVSYNNISAKAVIFCDGVAGQQNPYFKLLPFAFNKGEALIAHISGLPQHHIYKQGITLVPWKEKDVFWVGSNYVWNYTDTKPTQAFRDKTEQQLQYWLKLPYSVVDHLASERPANVERRPFVGIHPKHKGIGILNGMGTKGCSLAPFFANQLAQNLLYGSPIEPLADVKRFTRVLSRE